MNTNARFVVCKASAGSGKTYTLVREYLRLAFDVPDREWPLQFRRILAITFTNKAANEMKERVLGYLDKMARQGVAFPMGDDLAKRLGWDDARLRLAAQTVQTAILHHYSDFAVCTIDRFMSRIVHTFARDLNLPVGFDVATDDQPLIDVSVDALMDLAGSPDESDLTEILCDYINDRMAEGMNSHFSLEPGRSRLFSIDGSIGELAADLFKEDVPDYLQRFANMTMADFRTLNRTFRAANAQFEQQLSDLARPVVEAFAAHGLTADLFAHGKNGVWGFFAKCADARNTLRDDKKKIWPIPAYTVAFFADGKRTSAKCDAAAADAIDALYPEMEAAYRQIAALLGGPAFAAYHTRGNVLKNIVQLALLNRMATLIQQQYGEQELIHISEFNKQIYKVVQEEPMPFVYERIGSRYRYYLIDEFQDTSRMQWQNLLPLVTNGIAEGGGALVVGDAKQAIYRFRQGDVRQFVSLPHVDNALHGALLEQPGVSEVQRLECNYRSAATVVDFNNRFYQWLAGERLRSNTLLHDIFIGADDSEPDLVQQPQRDGGLVAMDFWDISDKKGVPKETMWRRVYDIVRRQVDEKGYRLRDILILARKKDTLKEVASYLSAESDGRLPVPMVSEESFLLSGSRAVMLLRAALLWVDDDCDAVAAIQVLENMRRLGLLRQDYTTAVIEQGVTHLETILQAEGITLSRSALREMPLYDCCEALVRQLGMADVETDYVISFLGYVKSYCRRHRNHIGEFVAWFDHQKLSLATTDALDAVRLYTIHKAKGLEAPVVIYLCPKEKRPPSRIWVSLEGHQQEIPLPMSPVKYAEVSDDKPLLYDSQLQEETLRRQIDEANLLYVATTRPCDKLFVLCGSMPKPEEESYAAWLHAYLLRPSKADAPQWRMEPSDAGERYLCGADDVAQRKEPAVSPTTAEAVHASLRFAPWEEKVVVADVPKELSEAADTPRNYGLAMHDMLSRLTDADDGATVVAAYSAHHALPEEWRGRMEEQIAGLLRHPESARFFDHRIAVRNECEMMHGGKVLRPDRVLLPSDTEAWIVDFKTGERSDATETLYTAQARQYMQAMREMGYRVVRGFLLYTQTATVVEV